MSACPLLSATSPDLVPSALLSLQKVAKYYKHFLVITILLIIATIRIPACLTLVLCINYISPLVHTNPYFPDCEDKAQGHTVSLGQSQNAGPGPPDTKLWGPTILGCFSSDTSHSLWKCNFCSADIFLH